MKTLIATILILVGVVTAYSAAPDTVKFTTRSNQGTEKDYVISNVHWVIDAGGTLKITAITDSTAQGLLYMDLIIPGFGTRTTGAFTLSGLTIWKYGHNNGQISFLQSGSITINEIDADNKMTGTFQWSGRATLPSGVVLNTTFSKGFISILRTPKLAHDILPKEGVKWKPEEKVKFTVITRKTGGVVPVPNAEVTIKLPPGIFEDTQLKKPSDANGRAEWNLVLKKTAQGGDYEIEVLSKKDKYDDSDVQKWKFKVDPTSRYYYAKCAGLPIMEFDAGEGQKWKDGGAPVIEADGDIKVDGFLTIKGLVRIDTTGGMAKVTGSGEMSVPGVNFDGAVKSFVFYNGPLAFPPIVCDAVIDLASTALVQTLAGSKIKEAKIRFLGDFVESAGLSVSAKIEGPRNSAEGCNDDVPFGTVWAPNKESEFGIEISFLRTGGATNVTAKASVSEVAIGASFCVKEFALSYDSEKSEFSISGKAKTPFFEEIAASITMKDGTLNQFAGSFKLGTCVAIPETPACFKGGGVSVENLAIGNPFKASINSIFQMIGKPEIVEITFTGTIISPPNSIAADGTINFLNIAAVSADKPWQCEGSIGFKLTLDESSVSMSGGLKAFHLGGDYFYDGKYEGTIGFLPEMSFKYDLDGSLKFPALPEAKVAELGKLGKFINQCAPIDVGKASGSIQLSQTGEQSLTIKYDMRNLGGQCAPEALKQIGEGSIYVDFKKLPSPSALVIDANFLNILKGWFSTVQDVEPGKPGEQVQAASSPFVVAADEKTLIAMCETTTPPADLTLKTPSGTVLSAADPANGIYRDLSPDGKIILWVIKNPVAGSWTVDQPQGRTADSVSISVTRLYPDLDVSATQAGDVVTVSWNASAYPAGSNIMIFAASSDTSKSGRPIYEGPATASPAVITLSDTSAPCEFYINASVHGVGVASNDKVAGVFTNNKESLLPPQNVMAVTNQHGVTGISWSPITNGIVGAVVVYRVDGGRMEVVTSAFNYETGFTFTMPQPEGAILKVASVDKKGRSGCLSEAISVTTDIKELEQRGVGMTMWLAPNPAFDQVFVRTDNVEGIVSYRLVDMMGTVVLTHGAQDTRTTLDLGSLPSGTYVLVAQVGEKHVASTLRIVR